MIKKLKKLIKSDGPKIGISLALFAGGIIFGVLGFEIASFVLYITAIFCIFSGGCTEPGILERQPVYIYQYNTYSVISLM